MSRRKRFLATISAALVAGAVATTVVLASGGSGEGAVASAAKGFTPSKIAGKWIGEWENTTFGSKGSIRANIQSKPGDKMVILADFGGHVFGCDDPKGVPQTLSKSSKWRKNTWNVEGFRFFRAKSPVFGELTLEYDFKTKALTGSGKAPPCNPSISFTVNGKLTPTTLTATVNIDLGSQTATSKLSAKKQ